jgi:hypothetical protein
MLKVDTEEASDDGGGDGATEDARATGALDIVQLLKRALPEGTPNDDGDIVQAQQFLSRRTKYSTTAACDVLPKRNAGRSRLLPSLPPPPVPRFIVVDKSCSGLTE